MNIITTALSYASEDKFQITGNLRDRIFYYDVNAGSLFNPNNILEMPTVSNNLRLEMFIDNKFSKANTHLAGRLYHSTLKIEKEYRSYLDEAYIDINFNDRIMLRTGKQRTVWSTGMAWNPSDVLNPQKDPTDPVEQKEGVVSVKSDIPLGKNWLAFQSPVVATVFVPKITDSDIFSTNRNQGALKFYSLVGGFDLHLISSFVEDKNPVFGLSTSGVLFDVLELHSEAIFQRGTERYYVTDDKQIFQSKLTSEDIFTKWLIGTRYTLPWDIVLLAEFYHTDDGYNNDEIKNYLDFFKNGNRSKLSLLPQRDLRKNYILINLSMSNLWDTFNVGGRMLKNLDDGSTIWSQRIEYIRITNVIFAIEPYFFWGDEDSEFGNVMTNFFVRFEASLYF